MTVDIGVDLGGTKMLLIARDPDGTLVAETRVPTGPATTPEHVDAHLRAFAAGLPAPVRTVALAVPGLVGADGEVVDSDVLPQIRGWRPRFPGVADPPFVLNDVRAALAYATEVADAPDVLCVVAGTAIAAAFTESGTTKPFHGADGWAGELGHLPTPDTDGHWTTLDAVAGGAALLRRLGTNSAANVDGGVGGGHTDAHREVVRAAGTALGRAIAGCVNLLNPRTVFVGGGACRHPGYLGAALDAARAGSITRPVFRTFPDPDRFAAVGALVAAARRG